MKLYSLNLKLTDFCSPPDNYHQYQGLNILQQTYGRNNNGRPLPPFNHQINTSEAYGSMIGNSPNGLLINNSANLLINGTNTNSKINLMNSKTNTLNKAQIKANNALTNANPYNTLSSINSKNESFQQSFQKGSVDSKPVLQPQSKVKKIYL